MSYTLCHRCAAAIENDDYSAFDFDAPDLTGKVHAWVEKVGNIIIDIDETELTGDCDACGQDIGGHGHTAEPQ